MLLLSAHTHNQQHYFHGAKDGWQGAQPLHEYNVGAACGAFWSGAPDAQGIPDSTMSDGTPNGFATLDVKDDGSYALAWHPARDAADTQIALHAPKVLRRGAWPAWGVYANVYMGHAGTRVEYRVDDGDWMPMQRVAQPDPRLVAENVRDDASETLRGFDRSPEASPRRICGAGRCRRSSMQASTRSKCGRSIRGAERRRDDTAGRSLRRTALDRTPQRCRPESSANDSTRSCPCVASPVRGRG